MTAEEASFLALGDSYTIGERVDPALRWPVQLAGMLREEGVAAANPVIVARTGWTTDELDAGITEAGPAGPFDLVGLLIGVNNQYRGRDIEEYRHQFIDLLERAIGYAGGEPGRVMVLSIPDWGVMPFAEGRDRGQIAREIDDFNDVNREESMALGVRWVDVTAVSRRAGVDPTLVAEDGLHPSGDQYTLWAEEAIPSAREILTGAGGES